MTTMAASAQKIAAGYYRVQNKKTNRFFWIVDNRAWMDTSGADVNTGAFRTLLGFNEKVVSNPSTICYISPVSNGQYNILGAGLDLYQMTGIYLDINLADATGAYSIAGSNGSIGKTLYDAVWSDTICNISTNGTNGYQLWYMRPVTGNYYYGIAPDVAAGGKYYTTQYASFPVSLTGSNVKAYYVKKIEGAYAIIAQLTAGVAENVPVVLECESQKAADNKLAVQAVAATSMTNLLKGVFFCNDVKEQTGHRNVLDYDASTMRVLGTDADGDLAFVTSSSLKYIPANKAYLVVPAGTPASLKLVTQQQYDTGVIEMRGERAKQPTGVYTLGGLRVADSTDGLPSGVYISAGKKVVVK